MAEPLMNKRPNTPPDVIASAHDTLLIYLLAAHANTMPHKDAIVELRTNLMKRFTGQRSAVKIQETEYLDWLLSQVQDFRRSKPK